MFSHLLKLIWNKKKQNFLLILEIFLSFIGLFFGATFVLYPYNNYKIPEGFDAVNVWEASFDTDGGMNSPDSVKIFRQSVKDVLLSMKQVEDVTYTSANFPYSGNGFNGPVKYKNDETWGNIYIVEDNYAKLLGMKVLEGRWFSQQDEVSKDKPIVINELLRKQLFDTENPLGRIVESEIFGRAKIIGVVTDTKHESEAEVPPLGMYVRMDTSNFRNNIIMLMKVKDGADPAFESTVYKTLSGITKNATIGIEHLTEMREKKNKAMRVPLIIFFVIASFLIINVALGIFGVLWYNIQKRRGEIGLRRAVGASGASISQQLVTEAVLIATLALLLGSFFAVQFPLLKVAALPVKNYVTAITFSLIFIYVLVIVCSLYPGKQAAAIYPADALHED